MRHKSLSLIVAAAVAMAATAGAQNLGASSNHKWWPEQLDLRPLRQQAAESDPMGPDFNYIERFKKLDVAAVKKDIAKVMTTSQAWSSDRQYLSLRRPDRGF